eukprot:3364642-Rhodomonas_salina.2
MVTHNPNPKPHAAQTLQTTLSMQELQRVRRLSVVDCLNLECEFGVQVTFTGRAQRAEQRACGVAAGTRSVVALPLASGSDIRNLERYVTAGLGCNEGCSSCFKFYHLNHVQVCPSVQDLRISVHAAPRCFLRRDERARTRGRMQTGHRQPGRARARGAVAWGFGCAGASRRGKRRGRGRWGRGDALRGGPAPPGCSRASPAAP